MLLIVIVEIGGSAAVNGIGRRIENVEGPGPVNAVDTPVPESEKGKETGRSEQLRTSVVGADVEIARGSVGGHQEETAGVGKEVETGNEGAGAGIVSEKGRGVRVLKGMRSAKEKVPLRLGSG